MKKSIFIVCLTLCFASSGASSNDFFAQYDEFSFAYAERKQHGVLDPLLCNQKPHSLFICDKGVFSQTEKFELSNSAITKSGTFFIA